MDSGIFKDINKIKEVGKNSSNRLYVRNYNFSFYVLSVLNFLDEILVLVTFTNTEVNSQNRIKVSFQPYFKNFKRNVVIKIDSAENKKVDEVP